MTEVIERLNYYQLQFLGAEDFKAEQIYHRDMRRRHNLGPHTWGIVEGLELTEQLREGSSTDYDVYIQPGLAIDGFGREIVVDALYQLDTSNFQFIRGTSTAPLTVDIAFAEEQATPSAFGYGSCDGDGQNNRVRELFRIVIAADPPLHGPIRVDGRDLAKLPPDASIPHQELPDTSSTRWLVRLGSVNWNAATKNFMKSDTLLIQDRPYASIVAAEVLAPDGLLRIRPREQPPVAPETDDFAIVQGRLRIKREVLAEQNVILYASKLSLATAAGTDDGSMLTMQRVGSKKKYELQICIGKEKDESLTIIPTGKTAPVLAVYGDDRVEIPTGVLRFGKVKQQMLVLREEQTENYGIGVQNDTLYFRSDSDFCWFRKGSHIDDANKPGSGGTVVMCIDKFDAVTMSGALIVKGAFTANGPLTANSTLAVNGALTANSGLTVTGGLTSNGPITASGLVSSNGGLSVTGNTQVQSLSASSAANIGGSLTVGGNTSLNGALAVAGQASIGGNLDVDGDIVMKPGHALVFAGTPLSRFPIDVVAGIEAFNPAVGKGTVQRTITVTSKLTNVTDAFIHVALAGIHNVNVATDARWSVAYSGSKSHVGNQYTFTIDLWVDDVDGFIDAVSYVAFFIP